MLGTTATHVADLSMLLGTVRSPAPIIWSRTTLAASTRACKSSRVEAAKAVEGSRKLRQIETQIETTIFFMFISFPTAGAANTLEPSLQHPPVASHIAQVCTLLRPMPRPIVCIEQQRLLQPHPKAYRKSIQL